MWITLTLNTTANKRADQLNIHWCSVNVKSAIHQLLRLLEIIWDLIPSWFFWRILKRLKGSGFSARLNNSVELSQAVDLNGDVLRWSSLLFSQWQQLHHKNTHPDSTQYMFQLTRSEHMQHADGMCPILDIGCTAIRHFCTLIWSNWLITAVA